MEEQAPYVAHPVVCPPEGKLSAAAVVALVGQVAALLSQLGFRVYGYAGQEGRLPPPASSCQDVCGEWQGPSVRFEVAFTGYPELGYAQVGLQAKMHGFRADTGYFCVHGIADVQFILDNWQVLHGERMKSADGEIGLTAVWQRAVAASRGFEEGLAAIATGSFAPQSPASAAGAGPIPATGSATD